MASRWIRRFIQTLALAERQFLASRSQGLAQLPTPDRPEVWCHRCGATRSTPLAASHIASTVSSCRRCAGIRLERARTVRLATYDSHWRDAILKVKHASDRPLARALGQALAQQLLREAKAESIALDSAIIVPVPMPLARRIERGIDHTLEVAKGVSVITGIPVSRCLMHRAGPVQAELTESVRRERIQRIEWHGKSPAIPHPRTVFLVDDVLTTGSTLLQASIAIRAELFSATIIALVIAVADKRRNA